MIIIIIIETATVIGILNLLVILSQLSEPRKKNTYKEKCKEKE